MEKKLFAKTKFEKMFFPDRLFFYEKHGNRYVQLVYLPTEKVKIFNSFAKEDFSATRRLFSLIGLDLHNGIGYCPARKKIIALTRTDTIFCMHHDNVNNGCGLASSNDRPIKIDNCSAKRPSNIALVNNDCANISIITLDTKKVIEFILHANIEGLKVGNRNYVRFYLDKKDYYNNSRYVANLLR